VASGAAPANLLECRPEPLVGCERDGERVVLLRPRFVRGPLAWWLQPILPHPHLKVHLDEVGSFVWNRCDGRTTVAEIAAAMETELGERVSPALDRLALFLRQLEGGRLIRMRLPEADDDPLR
jgi:hypothetical protein